MHKNVLTMAVLGTLTVAGSAAAQSNVTIYGLIDTGVENITNAGPGGSATRVSSGGMNNSRFGFRGVEDLGGGMKALFNLEGGLLTDVGASDGAIFRRQATVGLEGSLGRVVIGRSFSTVYDFIVAYDPMAYAPYYSWASSGSASGASSYSMTTSADNLVKYSLEKGPFKFGAMYGLGEQTSGSSDGAKLQGAVNYTAGQLSLITTYEQTNGNNVAATNRHDKTNVLHVGGMYNVGDFKLQLVGRGYKTESNNRSVRDIRANTYWVGVTYKATPALSLTGATYYTDVRNVARGTDADPVMYVLRARYALSKRTDVYLTGAYAKARNDRLISLSRNEVGFGDSQRGLMAGVQHRF